MKEKRKLTPRLLYLGILLFVALLAVTVVSISNLWQARIDATRASALYQLVRGSVPNRPTDTPGVIAWLQWELRQYLASGDSESPYRDIAEWQDYRSIPPIFADYGDLLAKPPSSLSPIPQLKLAELQDPEAEDQSNFHFRDQFYVSLDSDLFVVTRRRKLGGQNVVDQSNASNRFLQQALPRLVAIRQSLQSKKSDGAQSGPEIVRLYSLCENGMLATLPFPERELAEGARLADVLHEGRELRKIPNQPNFVSNEFNFVFNYDEAPRPRYSGLYLDLGGQGLIATLTAPFETEQGELDGVFGLDIALNLVWDDFVANIKLPLVAEVVQIETGTEQVGWRPWRALLDSGSLDATPLKPVLVQLDHEENAARLFHNPSPIYHGVARGKGAMVTFRVDATSWLVILFPETQPRFPVVALTSLSVVFLLLLAGFEHNRRRAETAQRKAVREFEEKQNLLDTMQVPLMVLDPNNEQIVYGNRAALELGIKPGGSVKALLADDPRIHEHYDSMQVTHGEDRRAYGVPLNIKGKNSYALIRSVAVRAPIEMIKADERHRLGILFIIDPEADLSLYTEQLVSDTRSEERRKLSGLLSHGVDTLARVLHRRLANGDPSPFTTWLSAYIQRRIRLAAWVLDNWQASPPLTPETLIEVGKARMTLERLEQVFRVVREDALLRDQLHWNNGALAAEPADVGPAYRTHIQWPEQFCFTCPVKGGFGLFMEEALINAIRHGKPGTVPELTVSFEPLRRELVFNLTNQIRPGAIQAQGRAYGGRAILVRLANLFEWKELCFDRDDDLYRMSWRVPVSERELQLDGD